MNTAVKQDDYDDEAYDALLLAELQLPNNNADECMRGTVIKRAKSNLGHPIGTQNADPNLDTRRYIVRMADGHEKELQHNLIATNMFTQADSEGRQFLLLDKILDFRKLDSAVEKKDGYTDGHNGNQHKKITTKGYKLLTSWKDGSTDWVPLKDMKASNPLEMAKFAVTRQINEEPAFAWWVSDVLKTRNRIIKKIKTCFWKQELKFGIKLPKIVEHAFQLDEDNRNDFWRNSIEKELKTVCVAYKPYL